MRDAVVILSALMVLTLLVVAAYAQVNYTREGVRQVATVSVPSSSVGTQVCDYIDNECSVQVVASATRVCLAPVNQGTTCAAGFTTPGGRCFAAGSGWTFLPREDGWMGQVCALLESGSSAATVYVVKR